MAKVVVITGTPGTGKTFIARKLRAHFKGSKLISANDLIKEKSLYSGLDEYGTRIVKLKMLSKAVENEIARNKSAKLVIIEGHLLSEIRINGAIAIVLREHLETIKKRLQKRGYAIEKIRDNIVDEAIDYCGAHAEENYKKSYEILSSSKGALRDAELAIAGRYKQRRIRLTDELLKIIKDDKSYAL